MSGTTADNRPFAEVLTGELGMKVQKAARKEGDTEDGEDDTVGVVNLRKLAKVCFKYDPNSLVHGIFLEKIAGRLRHPRALSAFIEASRVVRADSGGVKFDRALPKPKVAGLDAAAGYGNVPFHRTEFVAKSITAYFSLDLAQLRGYGLPPEATELLVVLSLWKVRKFLDSNMRLRSACELELEGLNPKKPDWFKLDSAADLAGQLTALLKKCKPLFAEPAVTVLTWNLAAKKEKKAK
jgi:CRISPR-associated protein Csb1